MQIGDASSATMKTLINEFSLQADRDCIKTKNGHQKVLERGQPTGTMVLTTECAAGVIPNDRSLLIVDDDHSFLKRLAHAMGARGFTVMTAGSVAEGLLHVDVAAPAFAVIDLRLTDGNGLQVISAMKQRRPGSRAIILTGFGNIPTAVRAVMLGAVDYLAKPVDADDVAAVLLTPNGGKVEAPKTPLPPERVRWEHIWCVHELYGSNVSETARRLGMHRRTLQRILVRHDRGHPSSADES
jgi:two-component system, response regulator RegA